jgi:hypothetical protein
LARDLEDEGDFSIPEMRQAPIVPPVALTILERDDNPSRKGLGRSVLSVLERVEAFEWPISGLSTSLVHYTDEFYSADSKKKPGQESPDHLKGDMKVPAHTKRFWWVWGGYPALRMGMHARWREGVTPKGGRSFGFETAHCVDWVGMPTELFADYSYGANDLKQKKDEPQWAHQDRVERMQREAQRRDRQYNLGQEWLNKRPMFTAFKKFEVWLADAIEMSSRITERKDIAA